MSEEKEARTPEMILVIPQNKPEIKSITRNQGQKRYG